MIYGPDYDEKDQFMMDLHYFISSWEGPSIIGGDFNLVRDPQHKNPTVWGIPEQAWMLNTETTEPRTFGPLLAAMFRHL